MHINLTQINMKKNYLFTLLTLLITSISFSQTTIASQDFETAASDTWNFTNDPATYDVSSDLWGVTSSVGTITSANSGSNFWGMRDLENSNGGSANEHVLTFPNQSVSGGTNILLSFYYYSDGFDSSDYLKVEYFFDDVSQGQEDLSKDTDSWTLVSKVVPNGTSNVSFKIIAKQNGGSDYAAIDNILLQTGANISPELSIITPTEGGTVNSGFAGVDISLEIQNFTLSADDGNGNSDNSGNGYISYTIDGGTAIKSFSNSINLKGLSDGAHTFVFELVDNSGNSLTPGVSKTLNININNIIKTLPFLESFDYTVGEKLADQEVWTNNFSGDDILIAQNSLSYAGLPSSVGNSITFDGSGADPTIDFNAINSGKIYASFIFKVTDLTNQDSSDYFAILRDDSGNYVCRLFIVFIDDSTYKIGISNSSTLTAETTTTYNKDDVLFVVMNYDFDSNNVNAWVNPTISNTEPAATLTDGVTSAATSMVQFMVRQDNAGDTPTIIMDELRVASSWADVASSAATASVVRNDIEGFALYPNPVTNKRFNITSNSIDKKQVSIYNVLGKNVLSTTVSGTKAEVNVASISAGIYILKVVEGTKVATSKLVIR